MGSVCFSHSDSAFTVSCVFIFIERILVGRGIHPAWCSLSSLGLWFDLNFRSLSSLQIFLLFLSFSFMGYSHYTRVTYFIVLQQFWVICSVSFRFLVFFLFAFQFGRFCFHVKSRDAFVSRAPSAAEPLQGSLCVLCVVCDRQHFLPGFS